MGCEDDSIREHDYDSSRQFVWCCFCQLRKKQKKKACNLRVSGLCGFGVQGSASLELVLVLPKSPKWRTSGIYTLNSTRHLQGNLKYVFHKAILRSPGIWVRLTGSRGTGACRLFVYRGGGRQRDRSYIGNKGILLTRQ